VPSWAGTTAGQDLNLSLERVVGSRNLTNKLWNAGKFVQMQLASCSDTQRQALAAADFSAPHSLQGLPLAERWVLSSLHQARRWPSSRFPSLPALLLSRLASALTSFTSRAFSIMEPGAPGHAPLQLQSRSSMPQHSADGLADSRAGGGQGDGGA
jgi:valyl-tRNA synthetase